MAWTELDRENLRSEWKRWLAHYPWSWFVTLTFRYPVHPEQARKRYGAFIHGMNQELYGRKYYKHSPKKEFYWVVALEYQKRGVIHFHALMGDEINLNQTLKRKAQEARWHKLAGFASIAPVDNQMSVVTGYVSKYVAKEGEIEVSDSLKNWSTVQLDI